MIAGRVGRARTLAVLLGIGATATPARAVDGIWTGPGTEWTTGTNWSSTPIFPDNLAIFQSNGAPTAVTITNPAIINTIQFDAGAPAFSFTLPPVPHVFVIQGSGIVNNSSNAPSFTIGASASMFFFNASTAGNAGIFND